MRHPDMLEVGNGMTENEDRDGLQFWFKPLAGGDWAFTIGLGADGDAQAAVEE